MVVLNRIYTRTGDSGTTALGSGERRPKYDLRVAAYGTVDETNAVIGLAQLHLAKEPEVAAILTRVQNDLFDLGADLANPEPEGGDKRERLRVVDKQVERLEADIDKLNAALSPLTSFVLPGGDPAAAHLHLARTVCRRAERLVVELAARPDERVGAPAIRYLNRLSDLLFVAARYVNGRGAKDVLWVPGANR
ncbi:MAG: cob(I)yrinic acid a,c-diamide adenosyltransferase [Bradyrhizobiaceae bacterium]|nr:cob(I)yrinic acid a,c-diamide adenosyltransferase [Bradyrhizobiaceae bacterium]